MLKRILFLAAAMFFLQLISSNSSISGPLDLDVAGVKLGMSPTQAEEALAKFNSGFKVTKKFQGSPLQGVFEIESKIATDITPPGLLCGLEALIKTEDGYEEVWTYFSPLKEQDSNNEKVVAVLRWKTYLSDFPKVEQIVKGLSEKIGVQPTVSKNENFGNKHITKYIMWCFNNKGVALQSISQDSQPDWGSFTAWSEGLIVSSFRPQFERVYSRTPSAQDLSWLSLSSLMPRVISSNEPITLQLIVKSTPDNPLIAQGFTQILIDAGAYLKAYNEAKKTLTDTANATRLQRQQDAAAASSRKEQF